MSSQKDCYKYDYRVVVHCRDCKPYQHSIEQYISATSTKDKDSGDSSFSWEKYVEWSDHGHSLWKGDHRLTVIVGFDEVYDVYNAKKKAFDIAKNEIEQRINVYNDFISYIEKNYENESINIDDVNYHDILEKTFSNVPKRSFKNSVINFLIKLGKKFVKWLSSKIESPVENAQ